MPVKTNLMSFPSHILRECEVGKFPRGDIRQTARRMQGAPGGLRQGGHAKHTMYQISPAVYRTCREKFPYPPLAEVSQ
jgi:hypothetical protein